MTALPPAGNISNSARTQAEVKQGLEDTIAVISELLGGDIETTLTIASGVVTPDSGIHSIGSEGAAATDDLANIASTNHPDGRLLMIRATTAAQVITVKHNAGGAGQVLLRGAADAVLDATNKWLLLKRTGANWEEITRFGFGGGNGPQFVTTVGGTANAITLTPSPAISSRGTFPSFLFVATNTNTAAVTINDGIGAVALNGPGGAALPGNSIIAGTLYMIVWDGAAYRISGGSSGGVASLATGSYTAVANGETTVTVSEAVSVAGGLAFYREGVRQRPIIDYTTNGTTSVSLAVPTFQGEQFWWMHTATNQPMGVPSNNSVGDPQLVAGAVRFAKTDQTDNDMARPWRRARAFAATNLN